MRASFLSPWCLLCEHCESGIKYLPHWVLLKKVNDFGQLYYLPQTLHCPIAVLSETCALASRPELLDPMELMLRALDTNPKSNRGNGSTRLLAWVSRSNHVVRC